MKALVTRNDKVQAGSIVPGMNPFIWSNVDLTHSDLVGFHVGREHHIENKDANECDETKDDFFGFLQAW